MILDRDVASFLGLFKQSWEWTPSVVELDCEIIGCWNLVIQWPQNPLNFALLHHFQTNIYHLNRFEFVSGLMFFESSARWLSWKQKYWNSRRNNTAAIMELFLVYTWVIYIVDILHCRLSIEQKSSIQQDNIHSAGSRFVRCQLYGYLVDNVPEILSRRTHIQA